MNEEQIIESEMKFGPYPEGHSVFAIEKSALYSRLGNGVKVAEFLLLRPRRGKPPAVWIIEAKTSAPKINNDADFPRFIHEIHEKLLNSLALTMAALLGRHGAKAKEELPAEFQALDLAKAEFFFILVIREHKIDWLPPLQGELAKSLKATIKSWKMPPQATFVYNQSLAIEEKLIDPDYAPGE